jgi:hypothetical protein
MDNVLYQDSVVFANSDMIYSGGIFYFKRVDEDTICKLSYEYYCCSADTIFIPKEFYRRYADEEFQYIMLLGKNSDTLFYYKASLFGKLQKVFITGKYYYQYRFGQLDSFQRRYFKIHKDSLMHVKGNNLPLLPANEDRIKK